MKPKLICLTSVLNESWILDRFIQSASLWADHIIIGDQGSTDGSIEIAQRYEKVIWFSNPKTSDLNEGEYRAPLFEKARQIEGPKVLITLDADEILTPNFDSLEWQTICNAAPGTIISMPIHNILSNGTYWAFGDIYCGYVDDGEPFKTGVIHAPRTIVPSGHNVLFCHDICLLHYKFMDWGRMEDRNRWYQCFELINGLSYPLSIFRRYHQIDTIPISERKPWPEWWKIEYARHNMEITTVLHQPQIMWNKQILDYFSRYGVKYFRHLNIWTVNWNDIARSIGYSETLDFSDPRTKLDKIFNRYLISSQCRQNSFWVHLMDKIVKLVYR